MPLDLDSQSFRSTVAFALGTVKLPSTRKVLGEEDRHALAMAVAAHFKLCGWRIETTERPLVPQPVVGPKKK